MHFLKGKFFLFFLTGITLTIMYFDPFLIKTIRGFKTSGGIVTDLFSFFIPIASFFGHGSTIAIIGLILLIGGRLSKRLQIMFIGKLVLICYVFSGITVQLLKHLFGRARPRLTDEIVFIGPSWLSGYDSFPSGHTAVVFCLAYVLSHYFRKYSIIFYGLSLFAGIERCYNLSHFPSDVFAGMLTGIIVGIVIIHLNKDGKIATNPFV